jgi:hypothetical protein
VVARLAENDSRLVAEFARRAVEFVCFPKSDSGPLSPKSLPPRNVGFTKRHLGNDLGERARVNPLPQEIDGRRFLLYGQPYYRQFLGGEGTDQLTGRRGGLRLPARSLSSLATDRQGSQSPAVLGQRT